MANANIELTGYTGRVIEKMISLGYAKTKTEAIRLAVYNFDQIHKLSEEETYRHATGEILKKVESGKIKTRKFKLSELD
ncbi:Uncharacterised protein [uncultured archaeon]|nr:Uncharacterised protein [uncultured archaeon]